MMSGKGFLGRSAAWARGWGRHAFRGCGRGVGAQKALPRIAVLAYRSPQGSRQPTGDPMKDETPPRTPEARPAPAGARKSDPRAGERLAAALRENLRRRKQQAKARRSDAGPAEDQGQD